MKIKKYKSITVYDDRGDYFGNNEVVINWAALGSVSIKEAKKFNNDLSKAIKYAEKQLKNK